MPPGDDPSLRGRHRSPRRSVCVAALVLGVLACVVGLAVKARSARAHASVVLPGAILIADRGNNRILLVNQAGRQLWLFPTLHDRRSGLRLNFDDDAFVGFGGTAIVANEEEAHTIVSIDIRTHHRIHLFGTPGVRGNGAHLLNTPDDAYPLPDGSVVVADAYNCRVLWIRNHRIVRQLGQDGVCRHNPPFSFGALNGDTPLPDGGLLLSEIPGHYVDRIGPRGNLVWSVAAPVRYPSDPQPLPGGRILLADYSSPGQVIIMNRFGKVLWQYAPASGEAALNHPSLALALPGGLIAVNDDYRHRVVVISIRTHQIVWQYGHTDHPGSTPGYLRIPDGMDFVPLNAAGAPRWGAVHHP
ncbi:MAG TPA: PQQ-binding-like beta-propeller repeat protein [Microbacteriaceae bacterium]|nr:PQQ-binding-like beta-propeller repeat protein [Microbacteriaceae bacterium]